MKAASVSLLSPSRLNLFQTLLLFFFAFSLSFQTGLKIDTSQAYFFGFLTDYFIFAIHPADILITVLTLVVFCHRVPKKPTQKISSLQVFLIISFLILVASWFVTAPNRNLVIFGLFRILMFFLTVFCFKKLCVTKTSVIKTLQIFTAGFVSGLIISISIGLIQFTTGISPNIPLIGSYDFSSSTPNIATSYFLDHKFLRAYGTTPHPNILSALIVFGTGLLSFVIAGKKKRLNYFYYSAYAILVLGAAISFSRTGILMLVIFLLIHKKSFFSRHYKYLIFFIVLSLALALWLVSGLSVQSKSVTERFELNLIGLKIFFDYPIFGVGVGNYLIGAQNYFFESFNLRLFQPPHNAIILFLAEYGVVGFVIALIAIYRPLVRLFHAHSKLAQNLLIPLLLAFIFGSLFDHYFLTQFQTNYILAILLGLILASDKMLDWK